MVPLISCVIIFSERSISYNSNFIYLHLFTIKYSGSWYPISRAGENNFS